jgi:Protein of unknown function (DUF3102)
LINGWGVGLPLDAPPSSPQITSTKGYINMPKDLIKCDASPTSLDDLARRVNLAHEGALRSARTAIEYAIECGRLLTEAKALVGHGNWLPWLKENTIVSERTAQRWMRFAANAETLLAKSDTDGGFTFAEADRLLAAPKAEPCEPPAPQEAAGADDRNGNSILHRSGRLGTGTESRGGRSRHDRQRSQSLAASYFWTWEDMNRTLTRVRFPSMLLSNSPASRSSKSRNGESVMRK